VRVISVEKGIPMPKVRTRGRNGGRRPEYPWATMEIGDSFLFPDHICRGTPYRLCKYASVDGREFRARRTPDGFRCWRVA
jgi:hypothetical protein